MEKYEHQAVEQKWRKIWEEKAMYKTPDGATRENKMYILPQLPYPSGSGLHVGHAEVYSSCDIYARYQRMNGKKVLQVIGWDAFGLPAENYAIKTNIHPRINTDKAIDNFREQIKSLGVSVDWDREVGSHNPDYYKWTQWFFLLMYKQGLAYRKKQAVNWCEHDKTVLANEQVIDGNCERCGNPVIQKEMEQWFLKITDYADRLDKDLDKVDWPEETKKRQRDWIGRSEGAQVKFKIQNSTGTENLGELEVFTTAHDTIFGATFMVVSPEHKFVQTIKSQIANWENVAKYIEEASHKSELDRQMEKDKTGIALEGIVAINPMSGEKIPVYMADYVLITYGTGAIMAVPGHDDRDGEFAKKYHLPIVYVTQEQEYVSYSQEIKPNKEKYKLANSGEFDGMTFAEGRPAILKKLEEIGVGQAKVQYRLRDWSVSRQRFWGAPVPMVYDPEGNIHPVKEEDLPVILPDDVDFIPTGQSPLTYSPSFQGKVEEIYGKGWKREVDTLDTFMCSSWYYYRYLDPHNDKAFASPEALKAWAPVDFYIGGTEHVNGHLLYSRFFTKVLFDAGYIDFDEPFLFHRHQGTVLGEDNRKMSKRWGNVINPTDIVTKYGADTLRIYEMFMGPLEQDKAWNDNAVQGVRRFLSRVFDFQHKHASELNDGEMSVNVNKLVKKAGQDILALSYNTTIAEFMKTLNEFDANPSAVTKIDWTTYLKLLAPFAPFLVEELWEMLGNIESIHFEQWPSFDETKLIESTLKIAVQINGKVRDTILISSDASDTVAIQAAKGSEKVQKALDGKEIMKEIYVPGKIVNIVAK
jgi:leucyl-tRNA synthetase